jgi:hypothetical protein
MTAPDAFWSTDNAAPGMGLSYWIEAICEAFLEMKADGNRETFDASLTKFQFGPIDLNFVDTDPQEVWRTRAAIARSRENFFYLLYMHDGHMGVTQRGREAVIAPGHCLLVDSREPYRFSLPDRNRCLSVQIPQHWLRTWLPHPEDAAVIPLADYSRWGRDARECAWQSAGRRDGRYCAAVRGGRRPDRGHAGARGRDARCEYDAA